jgi:CHAT domain-containing protein
MIASILRSCRQGILKAIALGLLTFILAIAASPIAAQHSPRESTPTEASVLLDRGIALYETGRLSPAIALWQQAAQVYAAQGDFVNQALSLNYLSLAYQDLGQWQEAEDAIARSLALLTNPVGNTPRVLAQALNTQGRLQLARGQTEVALETWKRAAQLYEQAGDAVGVLGSQINQAQALQALGLHRRARTVLERANLELQTQPDSSLKAMGLQSLGTALQVVGDLQQSQAVLEQSLAIARRLDTDLDIGAILFDLGNTARARQDREAAASFYQEAIAKATDPLTQLEARLNLLSLYVQTASEQIEPDLLTSIQGQLQQLPPSRETIYARVNFADSLLKLGMSATALVPDFPSLARQLATAVQQARQIEDPRAESYALGQMGRLYEQVQQWTQAQDLTQQALQIARGIRAPDIVYRWQWQLGRIFQQQGELDRAIAAYTEAVSALGSLRSDLVASNPDVQFSFTESVEPVYRELVALLLQAEPSQENLEKARELIESLQLAELDNFFREACLQGEPQQIDQIDPRAAVIYPIILPDRLAVILSLPDRPLSYYETVLSAEVTERHLEQVLESLNPAYSNKERLRLSQQLYDWLVQPAEAKLAESGVNTLVFVLDGSLRNFPMAALYDGQQYLIEKYSIALSQGLQLLDPRPLAGEGLKTLTGGLTEARQGFSALPAVSFEVNQIAAEVPAAILLDREFTKSTLEDRIRSSPFQIVHLATHGQFSSKAEDTFLLTWDGRINVKDLDELLRARETNEANPIELLVLSACQTATGDRRATLGLAGVAVRSGARSTLATLWSVRDRSTALLMTDFYEQLGQANGSKAQALRQAQLSLLDEPKYEHPFYWAPFILVGNWL